MSILESLASYGKGLSRDTKVNIITNQLPNLLEQGFNRTQAYYAFVSAGLGIRKSDFLSLARDIQGEEARAQRIRYVGLDKVPTDDIFEKSKIDLPNRYRFVVLYDDIDDESRTVTTKSIYFDTDVKMTRGELEGTWYDDISEAYPETADRLINVRLTKAYIR